MQTVLDTNLNIFRSKTKLKIIGKYALNHTLKSLYVCVHKHSVM